MNNIYLYLSSRIAGNSLSAVDLAKNNPTESNFSFATKLLAIKMKITTMKIQKNNGDSFFYKQKESKYKMLFQRLEAIKKTNKYQNEYNYYDSPGDKIKEMFEEVKMLIGESKVSSIKRKLENSININKRIEHCNDYRNIHINANDLNSFCLENRDLSNKKFKVSTKDFDIKNVNIYFSNSCLKGVDLSDVNIDGAIYKGADLTNAKIKIVVGEYLTDFSNATLDGATIYFSDSQSLNYHLNEERYKNSPFEIIKTISDKYKEIKVSLIKDIIKK
ncbi:pentapeptide repeat-containing protein [Proteus terrae]|uniref:pentapeptide repeat-containing protein n=1 Tax=Proteus terrae TaxID=1574161 RepID=UPI001BADF02B|nr:pentapeptide repeat-containing protein [Proteus terrae]QUT03632.1 pentapeptide repeat-containing protein [Proteus terrae subsp. cibarius]